MTATLDWFGCATVRLGVGGVVVFLDAYIDRVPGADCPPGASAAGMTEADELAAAVRAGAGADFVELDYTGGYEVFTGLN